LVGAIKNLIDLSDNTKGMTAHAKHVHQLDTELDGWCGVILNSTKSFIIPALFITGPPRCGKSEVVNTLVPSLIQHHNRQLLAPLTITFIPISCDTFVFGDVRQLCASIHIQLSKLNWASLPELAPDDSPLFVLQKFFDDLGRICYAKGEHCVFLVDEVQRLFMGTDPDNTACTLKHIFQPCPRTPGDRFRLNFRFVLTGSSEAALRAFESMPPHGSRFLSQCRTIDLSNPVNTLG
jgi:hypothetical protein